MEQEQCKREQGSHKQTHWLLRTTHTGQITCGHPQEAYSRFNKAKTFTIFIELNNPMFSNVFLSIAFYPSSVPRPKLASALPNLSWVSAHHSSFLGCLCSPLSLVTFCFIVSERGADMLQTFGCNWSQGWFDWSLTDWLKKCGNSGQNGFPLLPSTFFLFMCVLKHLLENTFQPQKHICRSHSSTTAVLSLRSISRSLAFESFSTPAPADSWGMLFCL